MSIDTESGLLAQLLAEREIVELLYHYCEAADAETPDAFVGCFTPDGLFRYFKHGAAEPVLNVSGSAELEQWFIERLPVVPPGTMNHTTVHPRVTVDGDTATSTSRFVSIRAGADGLFVASTGRYDDQLVRGDDGKWRFAVRDSIGDMPR